jgi:hypothetical protein
MTINSRELMVMRTHLGSDGAGVAQGQWARKTRCLPKISVERVTGIEPAWPAWKIGQPDSVASRNPKFPFRHREFAPR